MNAVLRRIATRFLLIAGVLCGSATLAAASDPIFGRGIVMARDVGEATLTINDQTFLVTRATTFEGLEGERLVFATMPIFDVHQGLFQAEDATKVEWRAERAADGRWVLQSVRQIDSLPR